MNENAQAVADAPAANSTDPLTAEFQLGAGSDLEVILSAWHEATERLQRTHEALRSEVRRLTDELEVKNRELARQNRLADLGQMATHVAHEVRNGLAPVTLYLSLLRRRIQSDASGISILEKIESGFTALETTVTDLLNFTSDRDPVWRSFVVTDLVREVCESLAPQLAAQSVSVEIDADNDLTVVADREMLRRALLNLVLNAVDVMPNGGTLSVTVWPDSSGVEIEIADTGPGLGDEPRKIFDPFFTTKSDGTGLGLAIVQRIVDVHEGQVSATNCAEGGAAFTIKLPLRQMKAAA
jgi:signal transduction histidine kinase